MNNSLPKSERMFKKKDISVLFEKGNGTFSFPYKVVYLESNNSGDIAKVSLLISVSKRYFKKAVDRNKIRRYIKEAYRLNKSILWKLMEDRQNELQIAIIYVNKEIGDFESHYKAMKKLLVRVSKEISDK